jgi:hypothetical protein
MSDQPPQRRRISDFLSKGVGILFGGVFILFWSSITLFFDAMVLSAAAMQLWSYTFDATAGTVLQCDVTSDADEDGTTYGLDIRYQYRVGENIYTSDRYRFGAVKTSGKWSEAIARQYPVDGRCTVYYDTANPERALLKRGIEGIDLYMLLFLTPFNLVMLAGWAVAYRTFRPAPKYEETGGVRVRDDGVEVRAFVPDNSALFVSLLAIGGTSFVMIFVAGCLTGMRPTLPVMFGVWGVVLGSAVWFGGQRFARDRAGLSDLVIDRFGQRLTLPATHGRKAPRTISFADVERITIQEERKVDSEGDATYVYAIQLHERGEPPAEHRIFARSERDRAELFLTWLRRTMGVAPDVQPAKRKRAQ